METVDARMAASIFSEGTRRENESRKEAVAKLFSADDATVRHFWQVWEAGGFFFIRGYAVPAGCCAGRGKEKVSRYGIARHAGAASFY